MFKRILQLCLNITLILLIFFPLSSTFEPGIYEETEGYWKDHYIFNDWTLALFTCPLIIAGMIMQIERNEWDKRWVKMFALMISGLCFLYAAQALILPAQDFSANYGMLLLLMVFPLIVLFCLVDR